MAGVRTDEERAGPAQGPRARECPTQEARCRADARQAELAGRAVKKRLRPGRLREHMHRVIAGYRISEPPRVPGRGVAAKQPLTLRIPRRKRKYASWVRVPLPAPTRRNEQWALDFMTDTLVDGRRFRVLTVLDVFARECLALEAATHFPASRVTLVLDRIVAQRGQPGVSFAQAGPSKTPSSSRSTAGCAMSASTPTGGRTLTKLGETWRIAGATTTKGDRILLWPIWCRRRMWRRCWA